MTLLGSCAQDPTEFLEYHKMVFWFNEETSRNLLNDGAETITFYVDNELVATSTVDDIFWTTAPSCDESTSISANALISNKRDKFVFTVKDQTGFVYYYDIKNTIHPLSCNAIEVGPNINLK
jgi:hypothetical protein